MRFADILMVAATTPGGRDPDVAAFAAASGAAGAYLDAVSVFVAAEKACGAWDLTDDYWVFWTPDAAALGLQALTSLKQRRLAVAAGTPTGANDRHIAFNGSTQYVDTGFIPGTHGIVCTGTRQRLEAYERTNVTAGTWTTGVISTTTSSMALISRNASNLAIARLNLNGNAGFAMTDSRGLKSISRDGSNIFVLHDRGVRQTDVTTGSPGSSAPTHSLYIGGANNAGTLNLPRAASVGYVAIGAPLANDTMAAAHYAAVQAFATAAGAQV